MLQLNSFLQRLGAGRDLALAFGVAAIIGMLILPMPGWMLDFGLAISITLSVMILMTALFIEKPLELSAFPTILLIVTMLRLGLNLASTRLILSHGHEGSHAAGGVIAAFGEFLMGGETVIGLTIFAILIVINFVVITKGAGRIAEVAARFSLDAMPGKQMAIDADLNAGMISEPEARKRRTEVSQEAEFYGAMDGASKYVKGDAVAGIMVTLINVIGGLIVGVVQHDMSAGDAAKTYTLLAIGDGLVAQIPSLIISIAAGMVVSRVANEQDIGGQMIGQLFAKPEVLYITGGIIAGMGLIPGMPNLV
ncbi:MAG: Flagellar biosynthesis protein FlhA, partial [Alphaproteobacteria bacterium]|nr:Flagellar biosynthesis protein FlhA [Alphaproteobacteria bacterium]